MATNSGRFGTGRAQRNKDDEINKPANRSPGQSNANSPFPSMRENVGASQAKDVERIGKGMNPTGQSSLTRSAQQNAGARAMTRTGVRGGLLGAAASLGPVAKELGDMYVNKVTNDLKSNRVELSADSKSRIAAGALNAKAKSPAPTSTSKRKEVSYDNGGVREGQNEGIQDSSRSAAIEDVNKHKWKGSVDYGDY